MIDIEKNGDLKLSYSGESPWGALGKAINDKMSVKDIASAAGANWEVIKLPAYVEVPAKSKSERPEKSLLGWHALMRSSDQTILTRVADQWEPTQNLEAVAFFQKACRDAKLNMRVTGLLNENKLWVLAQAPESFEVIPGFDTIDNYLLFTNPHVYGQAVNVRFSPIRDLTRTILAFGKANDDNDDTIVRLGSRKGKLDLDRFAEALDMSRAKFAAYKEMAQFLVTKRARKEDLEDWMRKVIPAMGGGPISKEERAKRFSRAANWTLNCVLDQQPGADVLGGTWWNALNACTFVCDHVLGIGDHTKPTDERTLTGNARRIESSWYGTYRRHKADAIRIAMEMAKKSDNMRVAKPVAKKEEKEEPLKAIKAAAKPKAAATKAKKPAPKKAATPKKSVAKKAA